MNMEELKSAFKYLGFPERLAAIGGSAEWSWSLEKANDDRWEVYWLERGQKNYLERFRTEHQACCYLLGRIGFSDPFVDKRSPLVSTGAGSDSYAVRAIIGPSYDPYGGLTEDEWIAEYWPDRTVDALGRPEFRWPEYRRFPEGFSSPTDRTPIVLGPGTQIDRFGPEFGQYAWKAGTRFAERGLPSFYLDSDAYHRYEVLSQLPAWEGRATPAFGQPGGGMQYFLLAPVVDLLSGGFLREVAS